VLEENPPVVSAYDGDTGVQSLGEFEKVELLWIGGGRIVPATSYHQFLAMMKFLRLRISASMTRMSSSAKSKSSSVSVRSVNTSVNASSVMPSLACTRSRWSLV